MAITGGCLCGAVRYSSDGPVRAATLCHCRSCRVAAGAPSVAWVVLPAEGFVFEGEPARFASSVGVERTFCGTCGTSLTYRAHDRPEAIDVTTVSLDDPEAFPPTKEIFVGEHLSWEPLSPTIPQYETTSVGKAPLEG
jgi:hypothetical protein